MSFLVIPKSQKFEKSFKIGLGSLDKLNWVPEVVLYRLYKGFRCLGQQLKGPAMIPYFKFYFFPHLVVSLQFRDPSYVLNLSTKAVL